MMEDSIGRKTLVLGNLAVGLSKGILGLIGLSSSEILGPPTLGVVAVFTAYIFIGVVTPIVLWGYKEQKAWSVGALFTISLIALFADFLAAIYMPVMLLLAIAPALTLRYVFIRHSDIEATG